MRADTSHRPGHLTGAELLRYLDGETYGDERRRQHDHLARCQGCAAELDRVREESQVVSAWLRRYDHATAGIPPSAESSADASAPSPATAAPSRAGDPLPLRRPPRRGLRRSSRGERRAASVPPWLKAAAAILLVAAPVVAVPAVRDWVAARVPGLDGASGAPETAVAAAAPGIQLIRFVPDPGPFTVRFDAVEPGGVLRVERTAAGYSGDAPPSGGDEAAGRAGGGGGADEAVLRVEGPAEPIVARASLRIRNGGPTPGRYTLRLPPATTEVRVLVAGRERVLEGGALDRGVDVPLNDGDGGGS